MEVIKGHARLLPAEINTDVHCSAKYMPGRDAAYIAQHAFEQIAPDFVTRFKPGDVIVAGKNFGTNSSREQAIQVLRLLGAAAIVCPAFARQFFRNAINNGLPVVECDVSGILENDLVELDLAGGIIKVTERGFECTFRPMPPEIQTLLAAGGLIPFLQRHPDWELA